MSAKKLHPSHKLIAIVLIAGFLGACNLTANQQGRTSLWQKNTVVHSTRYNVTPVNTIYRIDADDRLSVKVFGEPSLTGQYSVDGAGYISMPLISRVLVRGRTTEEIQYEIVKKLRSGYLRNPSVAVEVLNFRPFYILGEVQRAGKYPYVNGMTLQTAVAIAGGYGPRARRHKATVTRHTDKGLVKLALGKGAKILPGDTIYIKERFF